MAELMHNQATRGSGHGRMKGVCNGHGLIMTNLKV
jgi:hypothetical protein